MIQKDTDHKPSRKYKKHDICLFWKTQQKKITQPFGLYSINVDILVLIWLDLRIRSSIYITANSGFFKIKVGWSVQFLRYLRILNLKGETGKQALKLICLQFFQFLTYFNEILSISVFFQGCLNCAIRSDLTLLQSAHFALHSPHFAPVFLLFCFSR